MKILKSQEGYDYFAKQYKQYHNHLDSFTNNKELGLIYSILSHLPVNAKLLDLGCGDGRILNRIINFAKKKYKEKKIDFYGWDISGKMLEECKKRLNNNAVLEHINIIDEVHSNNQQKFDLVIFVFLLVHIKDIQVFFIHLWKILKNGGYAVFNTIPQKVGFPITIDNKKFKIQYFDHSDNNIDNYLQKTGFTTKNKITLESTKLFVIQKVDKLKSMRIL